MKKKILRFPVLDHTTGDSQSRAINHWVRSYYALISTIIHDWARLNEDWSTIAELLRTGVPRDAERGLRRLRDVFSVMESAFQSLHDRSWAFWSENHDDISAEYPKHPVFQSWSSSLQEVSFLSVDFPPHLKDADEDCVESIPYIPIAQCLSQFELMGETAETDSAPGAIGEDVETIVKIVLGQVQELTTVEDALSEIGSLADHSERHCELAQSELDELILQVSSFNANKS